MFDVGFTEIILILGLALLVLGPEKLPGLAEKIGRWTGRARSMARQLRTQLEHEVTLEELAKSKPMQASPAHSATAPVQTPSSTSEHVERDTSPEAMHATTTSASVGTPPDPDPEGLATTPEAMHGPAREKLSG